METATKLTLIKDRIKEMEENIIRKKLRQEDIRKLNTLTQEERLCLLDWHDQGIIRLMSSVERTKRQWHIT